MSAYKLCVWYNVSCERCIDIHKAQAVGISSTPCKCKCHDYSIGKVDNPASVTYMNLNQDTSSATANVKINPDGTFSWLCSSYLSKHFWTISIKVNQVT